MNGKSVVISEADFDRLHGLVPPPQRRLSFRSPTDELKQELGRGKVVAPGRIPKGVVTMNTKVRIRDVDTDERETYVLVYPKDADINEGRVSVLAPLGMALLGSKVGQVVEVNTPSDVRKIKVERILYQPEAAGDFHL